jgi:hypothetical protein
MISALHLHPSRPAPASDRVPLWRKAAYGTGGLTDFLFPNTVNALAIPIYSIALEMGFIHSHARSLKPHDACWMNANG